MNFKQEIDMEERYHWKQILVSLQGIEPVTFYLRGESIVQVVCRLEI